MPEEHNRRAHRPPERAPARALARAPSTTSQREGIDRRAVHLVGNTMIDSLLAHVDAARAATPWEELGVEPGGYGLVTLHRPALVDDAELLARDGRRRSSTLAGDAARSSSRCTRGRGQRLAERSGLDRRCRARGVSLSPPLGYLDVPRPRGRGALRAHRLRRRAGGDVGARRPLLHAARHDRAAGHRRARHEHRARRSSPERIAEIPPLLGDAEARRGRSRSGTATPASARRRRRAILTEARRA